MDVASNHILQSGYQHHLMRKWQCGDTSITPEQLVLPVFVTDDEDAIEPIDGFPKQNRYGLNRVLEFLTPLCAKGLQSVLLFGISAKLAKDNEGSSASDPQTPVIKAVKLIRASLPSLVVITDVCLCAYTNHGHCGVLDEDGSINNEASIKRIAEVAASYAKAGSHIVAPSDMMDGRIGAIKEELRRCNLMSKVGVMSYSAKFASCFYGPFRSAAKSAPGKGDRKGYQLPPGSRGLAVRANQRDVEEGADYLMVKPSMPYLDIVRDTKNKFPNHPLAVYQVSGEYTMLYQAASAGVFDLKQVVLESLLCMRRAGADIIITYFTPDLLDWLKEDDTT
ncbi:delta-aminolevulinic acid dehydratase-like [Apostichopus japonicus]|uniref:delta-aminolevulinic acid dehydratase-like n=1 Tax=Stichopus japonicus TaxID=307972 RepID=UPI003AB5A1BA